MDPTHFFLSKLIDRAVEGAADWHSEHEAFAADQVIAIALGSREGFVQYRRRLYLLSSEEVGMFLPGHRLSAAECRGIFGADGEGKVDERLEPGSFVGAELRHDGGTGGARLEVTGFDGERYSWDFPTLVAAEDLVARMKGTGVIDTGGG